MAEIGCVANKPVLKLVIIKETQIPIQIFQTFLDKCEELLVYLNIGVGGVLLAWFQTMPATYPTFFPDEAKNIMAQKTPAPTPIGGRSNGGGGRKQRFSRENNQD